MYDIDGTRIFDEEYGYNDIVYPEDEEDYTITGSGNHFSSSRNDSGGAT